MKIAYWSGIKKFCLTFAVTTALALSGNPLYANVDFKSWLAETEQIAKEKGISTDTWQMAFLGIEEPDNRVLEKAAYQPEFVQEVWEYLDTRVNQLSVSRGKLKSEQYREILSELEAKFGIPKSVILAIWSMETNYGAVLKRKGRLHYVPQALATLAWGDAKRSKFAENQLFGALRILQRGDISVGEMLGSWAGAMGHTQFIPTSYLAYAVDIDRDGKKDIWNSIPDALGTAANLLTKNGWRKGKTWGYEVMLPTGAGGLAEETKTLAEWQRLGVVRANGKDFPWPNEKAVLKVLAGEGGPGFLMMRNFYIIKRYNNSDKYALAVGLLADRISGWGGMVQKWPRPKDSLTADENIELQILLKDKGYYDGEIDGFLGTGTRTAIRDFEKDKGLQVNGLPTKELLKSLREK